MCNPGAPGHDGSPARVRESERRWETYPRRKQETGKASAEKGIPAWRMLETAATRNRIPVSHKILRLWNSPRCRELVAGSRRSGKTEPATVPRKPQERRKGLSGYTLPSRQE